MDTIQITSTNDVDVIGKIPYRMAFAGGWIDQPFISRYNPDPPGSMVVVSLQPTIRFMELSGMGTSTRKVAQTLWNNGLPDEDPVKLVHLLYKKENEGKSEPSGSQDMAGIIYPGICRLDYDFNYEGGIFPANVASSNDPDVAHWLENVVYMVPVAQRPPGYSPLGKVNLVPEWISRLGQTGRECFDAIIRKNTAALGASMNACMECWEYILPQTVRHPAIRIDLPEILWHYQSRYAGAMYSGCGGGYLYVVSNDPVPGGFRVQVRYSSSTKSL
ncbi:MAG: hypothetical protein GYA15_03830 [Leptolinea sp.]|jgi:hypothetical protein|nr:hypothetical protein [Leptolinea sp.]